MQKIDEARELEERIAENVVMLSCRASSLHFLQAEILAVRYLTRTNEEATAYWRGKE